ncbi:TIGR02391 family protein [Bosea sp. ASV33]|uniref:TIGR02391 family protein n=1 Tax=Bosea sp. ASV33 TaxID=2795106 RepID=UPI0018EC2877|nr:TIGR02391 family protein [Bosea sp. ASV33]
MAFFSESELSAIADALGDTVDGLSGSEIGQLLSAARIEDRHPLLGKRHRLFNAFAGSQNKHQDRIHVIAFIRKAMKPSRFVRDSERFEPLRMNLNRALSFAGMAVDAAGNLDAIERARTLTEASRRAQELRADLVSRKIHPDVLHFCREELLAENYFHAVLEATKSAADKIRSRTGLVEDGSALADQALGGPQPMLAINALATENDRSEQKGFCNLIKGTFGMFRNPAAHAPRLYWHMTKEEAEDAFSLISLIHRRLDQATMPSKPGTG